MLICKRANDFGFSDRKTGNVIMRKPVSLWISWTARFLCLLLAAALLPALVMDLKSVEEL